MIYKDKEYKEVLDGSAEVGDLVHVTKLHNVPLDFYALITRFDTEGDKRLDSLLPNNTDFLIDDDDTDFKVYRHVKEEEETLTEHNVKEGELFEVTDDGRNKFPTGTIVCSINSIQNDNHSSRFQDVVSGKTDFLEYNEIKRHTPEVLSEDNVKVGEYFVITDNSNCHGFTIGEIVKAVSYYPSVAFTASNTDCTECSNVRYTDVRRATEDEISSTTKTKVEEVQGANDIYTELMTELELLANSKEDQQKLLNDRIQEIKEEQEQLKQRNDQLDTVRRVLEAL